MEKEEILERAKRCLNCVNKPCNTGCPLSNDTAGFIKLAKEEKFKEAFELLSNTTVLPALCGKICPHSKQCQGKCVLGIKSEPVEIGEIEAFIGKLSIENNWKISKSENSHSKKVAIVGGGPAGLTCAAFLARRGVQVTIFEKHSYLGGLLHHGIPDFRLDRGLIDNTIEKILEIGNIEVKLGAELGKNISIQELEKEYDAIFLAFGANVHSKMNIPGEDKIGVFGGNEFLEEKPELELNGKTALVCGGGNVAMDVSRTLVRNGADVYVVYRRSENEMPAEKKEIADAKAEGVKFLFQNNIIQIHGESKVEEAELIKTELVQKPGETRLSPVNIDGSNYTIKADYVFMALGSEIERSVADSLGIDLDKYGKIVVNENLQTTNPKVFAGGDLLSNKKIGSVAWAARYGRDAHENILKFLETN